LAFSTSYLSSVLGTLVGLLIVLPLAYFQPEGGFQLLGLSLFVFVVVQLVESWLLTPKIMAIRSGLHPAIVVVSVFFWGTALGGIVGMILAVPVTAFLVAVWRQANDRLARTVVSDDDAVRIDTTASTRDASSKAPTGGPVMGKPTDTRIVSP
jgi:predicted PurR-regulated permease PerM